jgi:hypothetical protein
VYGEVTENCVYNQLMFVFRDKVLGIRDWGLVERRKNFLEVLELQGSYRSGMRDGGLRRCG